MVVSNHSKATELNKPAVFHNQPSRFRRVAAFCSAPDYRRDRSPRFEIARVLVRFDYVDGVIVNANHSAM
jgi:hypothetical protein